MCALSTETNATVLTLRLFAVLVSQRILNTEVSIAGVWAVNVNVCLFRSVCA
jgi:hypothetical protein